MKKLLLIVFLLCSACATNPPPNLTPAATIAFHNTEIQKALDTIRNIVDDGTKTNPALFSKALDVKVATWHEEAIKIIHSGGTWKDRVLNGLDVLLRQFSPTEKQQITPYVELAKKLIKEYF